MEIRALIACGAAALAACAGCRTEPAAPAGRLVTGMTYNVRVGLGDERQGRYALPAGHLGHLPRCARVIREVRPDWVAVEEIDRGAERTGKVDQTEALAKLTGMKGVFRAKIPYSGGEYGVALLLREEPLGVRTIELGASPRDHMRILVAAELKDMVVCATHFSLDADARRAAVEKVRAAFAGSAKPVFIGGDFNMPPDSPEFAALAEDFLPVSGTDLKTWPAHQPRRTIDYVFVDRAHAAQVAVESVSTPETDLAASDHRPLVVRYRLSAPAAAAAAEPPAAKASAFGWNPTNATACLQAALDSGAPRVLVDRQASEWLVETIRVPSGVELIFEDGVVVRARPGSMQKTSDCLFVCAGVTNVVFRGVGKASLRMNSRDYLDPARYRHGEHRHLISIRSAGNVVVRDLELLDSGGDGVYMLQSRGILLENLVCRGHVRQGTSLISGGDIVIRNCVFAETKGALPECGMDIEPARATFTVEKVLVDNCLFCSNNCSGLAINVSHFDRSRGEMDVTYRNCRFFDNKQRGIWTIFSKGLGAPAGGRVLFEGCEAWNNGSGPLQVANLESDGVALTFRRCRFDASGMVRGSAPIVISNGGVKSDLNNLSFEDCTLVCPAGCEPVSFGAMTGCGVLPGGAKGVLRVAYTDGTAGSFDFSELERRYVPQPELRKFETGVVDVSKLAAAKPDARAPAQNPAGYRGPFTFLQSVPGPGTYPIRFQSRPLGKNRRVAVQVEVFDPAGTPHDAFTVTERDFVYPLRTTARAGTIYRFEVKPSGARVVLSSETPGQGFVATGRIHWLTGDGEDIYFQARPGAGDVKVELTMSPHEWISAELIAPDGAVADKCERNDSGVILRGKRAPDAPAEVWRLHVTKFVDDCHIRLGAATTGVYAYAPEMLLVERR